MAKSYARKGPSTRIDDARRGATRRKQRDNAEKRRLQEEWDRRNYIKPTDWYYDTFMNARPEAINSYFGINRGPKRRFARKKKAGVRKRIEQSNAEDRHETYQRMGLVDPPKGPKTRVTRKKRKKE